MAELVGELEAPNESVTNLLVLRLALVPKEDFTKALHGIAKRCNVELHRRSSFRRDGRTFAEMLQAAVDPELGEFFLDAVL